AVSVSAGTLAIGETTLPRHTSAIVLRPSSVSVTNAGSALDMTNHDMMLTNNTPASYASIMTRVNNGMGNILGYGDPSGPQITSSSSLNNPNFSTILVAFEMDSTFGGGVTGDGSAIGFSDPGYTDNIAVTQPGTV